jgi:hypothetical protein
VALLPIKEAVKERPSFKKNGDFIAAADNMVVGDDVAV